MFSRGFRATVKSSEPASAAIRCCVGIVPPALLAAGVEYCSREEGVRRDGPPDRGGGWLARLRSVRNTFYAADREREVRHITVPCGEVDFDVYVLGTNHRTRRSSLSSNVTAAAGIDLICVPEKDTLAVSISEAQQAPYESIDPKAVLVRRQLRGGPEKN